MSSPRHRERGVALLTAMLVVTLATVLAVSLLWSTSVNLQRTETLLVQEQARQINLGFESVAMALLAADGRRSGQNGTFSAQNLTTINGLPAQTIEGGSAQVHLEDGQGKFNLNDLVDATTGHPKQAAKKVEQFTRILQMLPLESRPPLSPSEAQALAEAVVDWIDPDSDPEPGGAEDAIYTNATPAYWSANFWFVSPSELLAVRTGGGDLVFSREIYEKLLPYIAALPPRTDGNPQKLNVNTADPVVLASLVPNLSPADLPPVPAAGYDNVADFLQDSQLQIDPAQLTVNSDWFLLRVTASIGTTRATLYSLLERNGDVVQVRRRSFDAE